MDRQIIAQHLALAERHVAQGRGHIDRQRQRIVELDRDGHDSAQARNILANFERTQALHVADRDRLQEALAAAKD